MPTREQLDGALHVLVNLTRSVAIKRALSAAEPDPHLNFWRVLQGNLFDVAVLEWCKLFGSDDEDHQQVHWKNMFADEGTFRQGLLQTLGIEPDAWSAYWKQLKSYRDQHVAHLDFNRRDLAHFPALDLALASSFYYYRHLIEALRSLGEDRYPDDLRTYYNAFRAQAAELAGLVTASTREFPERVL